MYYINTLASISLQDSFEEGNIYTRLKTIDADSEVIAPNYKEFIPPASLRRLSPVLRMGLTASMECRNKSDENFDSIVVGTSLGCLRDTQKFLETFITSSGGMLSPTSFIQSTHNTIGGQISLGLGNHAYNMTHTQNSLSFEVSLLDAFMCIDEGKKNVLVGAADEEIEFLKLLQPVLIPNKYPLSSGASFFVLSPEKSKNTIGFSAVKLIFDSKNIKEEIADFLASQNIDLKNIDLIAHSDCEESLPESNQAETLNYLAYSGLNYCASSLASHIAHDYLNIKNKSCALIVNNLCSGNLGLTLIINEA